MEKSHSKYEQAYFYDKAMHLKEVLRKDEQRQRHLYFILQKMDSEIVEVRPEPSEEVVKLARKRYPFTYKLQQLLS